MLRDELRQSFATCRIDRMSERRDDDDWVHDRLAAPETVFVPLWRSRVAVRTAGDGAALLRGGDLPSVDRIRPPTLLGVAERIPYFAVTLNDADREAIEAVTAARFADLRHAVHGLSAFEAGLLAYAKALHYWQHRHTFCGVCGAANRLTSAGHRMVCTNDECGRHTFPRIDPAIIVLVTHGDACLLGRQPGWPAGRYSTLAGFVEPGESLEDAVRREVFEEAGVVIERLEYRSSQPWPFPASAMAGFHATAARREIRLGTELEDARWLSAAELAAELQTGRLLLPPPVSIAYGLIAEWFDSGRYGPLEQRLAGSAWRHSDPPARHQEQVR